MSIKQLIESGGSLNDVAKLVDPSFNASGKFDAPANKPATGGTDDPKELMPQQRRDWNRYVQYVDKRGYKGSPLLDKKDTGLATKLFEDFKKENPGASIDLKDVASVQFEMQKLRDNVQDFAKRHGDKNAENLMANVSKIDSWPGSKTTQFMFPDLQVKTYEDNNLVSNKNLGVVDPNLQPSGSSATKVPKGKKTFKLYDKEGKETGEGYNNDDGDIVIVKGGK